ncbi:F-box only protein 33 [Protobothrops mucrosquamatus]|uniref:F-box only protein 33 n=1 Tax=Protobothrops mucrosquamatus TaxID=103944 RepID=UPI0010FB71CB|nr:F-box only protein 33 [Protobothrops mucrosquamatus]
MHSSDRAATLIRNPMVRPRLPLRLSAVVGSGGSRVPSGPAPPPSALSLMLLFLSQEPEGRPGPGPGFGLRPPAAGPAMSSVCGGSVGAGSLPSELVVHIFSFLAAPDRLRASAACSHWRECLFYPALWPRLRLSLRVCPAERPRLDFLMRKCGWFVRELRVQFAADNYPSGGGGGGSASGVCEETAAVTAAVAEGEAPLCPRWLELLRTYLELVLCVLSSVRNNRNLQKLSLFGDISILQQHGIISNTYLSKVDPDGKKIKQIQQLFEEILGNSRQLKWLSCGFMLQIVTPTSLSSLSNSIASTMEHLSLLDNHIPGNTTLITAIEMERFINLRSLALDFCDFTGEMARVLADNNHVPLHRLSLLVHNISVMHKSLENMPEDEDWKALTRNSTNLRVYIIAFDIKSDDMLRILKPSIPLERIHFDSYITCVSGAVVDLISRQYDKFLTHFILMNDVIDMSGFPDLSDNRTEDPLVLLAWRCTRLSLLAVHGYTVWAHNLIAIARLRGSDLKVLEVTEESIDFDNGELADQDVDPVHNLIEQVSLGLGRPWHAVMDIELLSVFTEPTRHFYREMQSFSEGI